MASTVVHTIWALTLAIRINQGFILDSLSNFVPHTVCYGDLGCFSNGMPFLSTHRPISVVPESPDAIGTRFLLYTRDNPLVANEDLLLVNDPTSLTRSHFSGNRDTKVIVHGFTHTGHRQWIQNMTAALLKKDDFNVVVVDWHKGSTLPYEQATANTRVVGAQTAQMVHRLMSHYNITSDTFHIIGHSLGSHIAGYAGERINNLGRITGLDPASPYFENTDVKVRLDPSDADFVDVIHTDGGGLQKLGFGCTQAVGHVDYYPNGGMRQPQCAGDAVDKLGHTVWTALTTLFDYYAEEEALSCSHERSYYYFTESINSACPFTAFQCASASAFHQGQCLRCSDGSCGLMGYHADETNARGSLFLETTGASTFCEYTYQVNVTAKDDFAGTLSIILAGTKGTTAPIKITGVSEHHNAGTLISKTFNTRVDVGDVTHLTLHYEKTSAFLVNLAFPDRWHLNSIDLWSADSQNSEQFCAYHHEVDNHNSTTFGRVGTC